MPTRLNDHHRPFALKKNLRIISNHKNKHHINALAQHVARQSHSHIARCCYHTRGHGGVKKACRVMMRQCAQAHFVARFDVKHYYDSLNHSVIINTLQRIALPVHLIHNIIDCIRAHPTEPRGIKAGNALAPLIGALYCTPLDKLFLTWRRQKKIIGYVRYMDDIVILCRSRWTLRRAIKALHTQLAQLRLTVHTQKKRMIGRTRRGFDFCGYHIAQGKKIRPSSETLRRFQSRLTGLKSKGPQRLRSYVIHWQRYIEAGLNGLYQRQGGLPRTLKRALHFIEKQQITAPG